VRTINVLIVHLMDPLMKIPVLLAQYANRTMSLIQMTNALYVGTLESMKERNAIMEIKLAMDVIKIVL